MKIISITAHGRTFKVCEILTMDVFGNDLDIQFKDERGNYHHYQSWHDGGFVTYEGGEE